jgi:CheY-like chemotaxis protein
VVEDNPVNQKVTMLILRNLGYAADLAEDGREALEALTQKTYRLEHFK